MGHTGAPRAMSTEYCGARRIFAERVILISLYT